MKDQMTANFFRFLFIFIYFIVPIAATGVLMFIRELNRNSKVVFLFYSLRRFYLYKYVLHNVLFVLMAVFVMFDLALLFYAFTDEYLLERNDLIRIVLGDSHSVLLLSKGYSFFWLTMIPGCLFHMFFFCFYCFHNLYTTNSYFAERGRRGIIRNRKRIIKSRISKGLSKKYPNFYARCRELFIDVEYVTIPTHPDIEKFL